MLTANNDSYAPTANNDSYAPTANNDKQEKEYSKELISTTGVYGPFDSQHVSVPFYVSSLHSSLFTTQKSVVIGHDIHLYIGDISASSRVVIQYLISSFLGF